MAKAVFTQGSTLKHIFVMTSASTVGLMTLFLVDLVDMYFLSLLGQQELAAAVGFAGTLLFFLTSVGIGLQIGMGALVARAEGAHDRILAGRYCSHVLIYSTLFAGAVSLPFIYFLSDLLMFLGAKGKTLEYAIAYSQIILPSTAVLAAAMGAASALRALGDARHSMYATLGGGLINAVLDPIFIFGFGWNIEGAAAASVIARFGVLFIALYPLIKTHALLSTASFSQLKTQWLLDAKAITGIAGPAMLTNLATPIGSSFVLKTMATYGDSAVAGAAILGRLTPVAFAAIFALSGSVGPIMAQNFGAKQFVRVRSTLKNAVMVNVAYVLLVWGLLYMAMPFIISAFDATAEAAMLIRFYLTYMVGVFSFTGMLFIANASFNNLGYAHLATLFNFSRALLGTIPFVMLFSFYFGARGVLVGELAAGLVFGSMALIVAFRLISRLESDQSATASKKMCADQVIAKGVDGSQWPYSSQQSQLGQRCSQMDADTGKAESGY